MYNDQRILAIVPARGGSKGIPKKNIYEIGGKPLIAYTLEAAKGSRYVDYILVSTDSEEIAEVSRKYGGEVPFYRSSETASDTSKTIDAIVECLDKLKDMQKHFDVLLLLQPTSPLRTSEDIDRAVELFFEEKARGLVSVSDCEVNPVLIRRVENHKAMPILSTGSTVRRQDFDAYYRVNGAIYINRISEINSETSFNDNETSFIMEASHSIDIDTFEDIEKVRHLL